MEIKILLAWFVSTIFFYLFARIMFEVFGGSYNWRWYKREVNFAGIIHVVLLEFGGAAWVIYFFIKYIIIPILK